MKRLVMVASVLATTLAFAGTASADPVTVGNLVAGPVGENATAAGSAKLVDTLDPPANLPLGTDAAAAGDPVPPAPYAQGVNVTFEYNEALGGVGPEADDVVAGSAFFGGDFTQASIGSLSADTD